MADDDWIETVGIGGGILLVNGVITFVGIIVAFLLSFVLVGIFLFPVVLLVSFLITVPVLGFNVRILRATIRGEDVPPRFGDWGDLFREGLYVIGIGVVYTVPLIVVSVLLFLAVFVFFVLFGAASPGQAGDAFATGGSLLFVLGQFVYFGVVTLYSMAMAFLVPVSVAIYAHEDDFRAAFSVDRIRRAGLNKEFAVPWLVAVVGAMVVNNVAGILMFLLVGFFVQFYVQMVMFRLIGLGYVDSMGLDDGTSA